VLVHNSLRNVFGRALAQTKSVLSFVMLDLQMDQLPMTIDNHESQARNFVGAVTNL